METNKAIAGMNTQTETVLVDNEAYKVVKTSPSKYRADFADFAITHMKDGLVTLHAFKSYPDASAIDDLMRETYGLTNGRR